MQEGTNPYAVPYQPGVNPNPNPFPPRPIPPQQFPPYPTPNANPNPNYPNNEDVEESYLENILRLNRGKLGTFYFTYTDSLENRDRVYQGIIEAAGKDHIIISSPKDGRRYILLSIYLTWVEFNEEINYEYPIR